MGLLSRDHGSMSGRTKEPLAKGKPVRIWLQTLAGDRIGPHDIDLVNNIKIPKEFLA